MSSEPKTDPALILLVDKPYEWTSFGVVKRIRYHYKLKKVGHAGTLDPLATGLLILCTGKKTKEIEGLMGMEKEYTGTIELGATTPSFDLETEVVPVASVSHLTESDIKTAVEQLTGWIDQTPPQHSAIKIDGKRAYLSARKGEEVELKSRKVQISTFEVIYEAPNVHFRVVCSKGTYIRSLARDLGEILKVGGHLTALRRTRIGNFSVENALQVDQLPPLTEITSE